MQKLLFQEACSACCVCGLADGKLLEIHHITGETEHHDPADMLVLYPNCHSRADQGEYTPLVLYRAKASPKGHSAVAPSDSSAIRVGGDGNVVAGRDIHVGDLTVKTTKVSMRSPVLPGTVATNPDMANYLEYLVARYIEFNQWGTGGQGDRAGYIRIRASYKKQIGSTVMNTPISEFERACVFLQKRIANTKIGRIKSRQHAVYSTFEQWRAKRRSTQ